MKKTLFLPILIIFMISLSYSVFAISASIGNARMILNVESVPSTLERTIKVNNVNDVPVFIELSLRGDLVGRTTIIDNNVIIQPEESKDFRFKVYLTESGKYEGSIEVKFYPVVDDIVQGSGIGLQSTITILVDEIISYSKEFDLENYPGIFMNNGYFDGLIVVGENAPNEYNLAIGDIAPGLQYAIRTENIISGERVEVTNFNKIKVGKTVFDSDINDINKDNLIVIGNECENTVAAKLMNKLSDCPLDNEANIGYIKLFKNGNKVSIVISGDSPTAIRRAATVLANYQDYQDKFRGDELRITGTGLTITTIDSLSKNLPDVDLSKYPQMFLRDGKFDGLFVLGKKANTESFLALGDLATSLQYSSKTQSIVSNGPIKVISMQRIQVGNTVLDSKINKINGNNYIIIGGPCQNSIASKLLNNPTPCDKNIPKGKGIIKTFKYDDKVAIIVYGDSASDTRRAAMVLANYEDYTDDLKGSEVIISGNGLRVTDISSNNELDNIIKDDEQEPFCGDDICNNNEDCHSCSFDCGVCPEEQEELDEPEEPTEESSIAASIGNAKTIINAEVKPGKTTNIERSIRINNVNSFPVLIQLNPSNGIRDIITIADNNIILEPSSSHDFKFIISVSQVGLYEGSIGVVLYKVKDGIVEGNGIGTKSEITINVIETPEPEETTCNGCIVIDDCYIFGTRFKQGEFKKYCDVSKQLLIQKEKNSECQNNYECKTNQCIDEKCMSMAEELRETRGILQKFLSWVKTIFG